MITVYNSDYKSKYTALFDEAYDIIKAKYDEDPVRYALDPNVLKHGCISSLEEYFAHIGYLAEHHSQNVNTFMASNATYQDTAKFLMLPMDEKHDVNAGCFYIDLNSRNIQIPAMYAKNGVSITGDQLAETLMFKVPRYFDYTDLTSTEIYVQWTNPAGKEGASRIVLVDFEAEEGYILFGWPLTSNVTVEGNNPLKFSVRFFTRDADKNIKYSLNTLPASVMIKQALYTNFNNDIAIDDPSALFNEAIRNGVNGDTVVPLIPKFFEEWVQDTDADGFRKVFLDENDALEMVVQGGSPDTGMIMYRWAYYPRFVNDNKVMVLNTHYREDYTTNEDNAREKPISVTEPLPDRTYWTKTEDGKYIPFAGNSFDEDETYYEMVSVYTIPAKSTPKDDVMKPNQEQWAGEYGHHITGDYKVMVLNKIGSSDPAESHETVVFTVPCIEYVNFESNLPDNAIIQGELGADLDVNVVVNDNADKTYVWTMRNLEHEAEVILDEDGKPYNNFFYKATKPGWYQVEVIGSLNREEMHNISNECKVTNPIAAPVIKEYYAGDIVRGTDINETFEIPAIFNKEMELKVEIDELNALETDKVTYTWYRNTVGANGETKNGEKIEAADGKEILEINGNVLKVKLPENAILGLAIYYCEISNTLGKDTLTTESDTFMLIGRTEQ